MKIVIVASGIAMLAADAVVLFPDHAIINPSIYDEDGQPLDGARYQCFNDSMTTIEAVALPQPWVSGAYRLQHGQFVLDTELPAWQAYQAALADAKLRLNSRINEWRLAVGGATFPFQESKFSVMFPAPSI
jgi:hypothetical protein